MQSAQLFGKNKVTGDLRCATASPSREEIDVHMREPHSGRLGIAFATQLEIDNVNDRMSGWSESDRRNIWLIILASAPGHGLPLRLRWHDDRCTPGSRRLAATPKSAAAGQEPTSPPCSSRFT